VGKTKDYKKQLEGHRAALKEHYRKIVLENSKPIPRQWLLKLWKKQVANILEQITKIERRLER
jgi:hypothetical protein